MIKLYLLLLPKQINKQNTACSINQSVNKQTENENTHTYTPTKHFPERAADQDC